MLNSNVPLAVSSKVALEYIPPFPFAAIRVFIALPLLWGVAKAVETGGIPHSKWHYLAVAALGLTGVALPQGLIFIGIRRVGPDVVAIMQPTIPVLVMLLTAGLGHERLTWVKMFGIVSSVGGAIVMLDISHLQLHSSKSVGMIIMILQVCSYAVFITGLSKYLKQVPKPFTVFFWVSLVGCLILSAASARELPNIAWGSVPGVAWACLLYAAVGVSFLAHGSVSWAVRHVPATIPSLYTCVQPLATTVLSAIIYGDKLEVHHALGMLLILAGLFVTVLAQRAESRAESSDMEDPNHVDLKGKRERHVVQLSRVDSVDGGAMPLGAVCIDDTNDTQPLITRSDASSAM